MILCGVGLTRLPDKKGKSGKFILVNKLADTDQLLDWTEQAPSMGLLMVLLSIIHLNDGAIEQGR